MNKRSISSRLTILLSAAVVTMTMLSSAVSAEKLYFSEKQPHITEDISLSADPASSYEIGVNESIELTAEGNNPTYTFTTLEGTTITTQNKAEGGTVFIFGRPTCGNTRATLTSIANSSLMKKGKIDICFVDIDQNAAATSAYRDSLNGDTSCITFCPDLTGTNSSVAYSYLRLSGYTGGGYTLPLTVIIDNNNNVVNVTTGVQSAEYIYSRLCSVPCSKYIISGTENYDDVYKGLEITNRERAAIGAAPLTLDADLVEAAMQRAAELSLYYSHTRPDGSDCFTVSSKAYAENISYGYLNIDSAMNGWINSSGHYANMTNSGYSTIGIGSFTDINGNKLWVQLFGRESPRTFTDTGSAVTQHEVVLSDLYFNIGLHASQHYYMTWFYRLSTVYKNPGAGSITLALNDSAVTYTSDSPSIATINDKGFINVHGSGTVRFRATLKSDPDITAEYTLTFSLNNGSASLPDPTKLKAYVNAIPMNKDVDELTDEQMFAISEVLKNDGLI